MKILTISSKTFFGYMSPLTDVMSEASFWSFEQPWKRAHQHREHLIFWSYWHLEVILWQLRDWRSGSGVCWLLRPYVWSLADYGSNHISRHSKWNRCPFVLFHTNPLLSEMPNVDTSSELDWGTTGLTNCWIVQTQPTSIRPYVGSWSEQQSRSP